MLYRGRSEDSGAALIVAFTLGLGLECQIDLDLERNASGEVKYAIAGETLWESTSNTEQHQNLQSVQQR